MDWNTEQVMQPPTHISLREIGWRLFERGERPQPHWPAAMVAGWRAALRAFSYADASAYLVAHRQEMVLR